jgi:hypothetical protein
MLPWTSHASERRVRRGSIAPASEMQVASHDRILRSYPAMHRPEHKVDRPATPDGRRLIALAQQLARDAERHALLSASLASQAERLMVAGLRRLETHPVPARH